MQYVLVILLLWFCLIPFPNFISLRCDADDLARPLYAADTPSRLPVSELMVGLPNKLIGLLLPLVFTACDVCELIIQLTPVWTWCLALTRSSDQVLHVLSLRPSSTSILIVFALSVAFANWVVPFAVAPFERCVARLEAGLQGF